MEGEEEACRAKINKISDEFDSSSIFSKMQQGILQSTSENKIVTAKIKQSEANKTSSFIAFWWLLWRALIAQVSINLQIFIFYFFN